MIILMVLIGGAIGAPIRMWTDSKVTAHIAASDYKIKSSAFPFGTYLINMSGSFLLGFLTGLSLHYRVSDALTAFLGVGFCGAYTTFSTWSFESVRLFEKGSYRVGVMNIVLSLGVGVLLAVLGIFLGELL